MPKLNSCLRLSTINKPLTFERMVNLHAVFQHAGMFVEPDENGNWSLDISHMNRKNRRAAIMAHEMLKAGLPLTASPAPDPKPLSPKP